MRLAIFFTPDADDPLAVQAATWLGRNAFTGEEMRPIPPSAQIVSPRRYGFHATIRAPFSLRDGVTLEAVDAALAQFCSAAAPVVIDPLVLRTLDGFLALVPQTTPYALIELQHQVLMIADPLRRPLTDAEIKRRRPDRLTPNQRAHLEIWGYPFVLDEFQFHMTLSERLDEPDRSETLATAEAHFNHFLGKPLHVDRLAIFVEPNSMEPFRVHSIHTFGA